MRTNNDKTLLSNQEAKTLPAGTGLHGLHSVSWADYVSDSIVSTDLQFHVLSCNKAAIKLYGFSPSEILGKDLLKLASFDFPLSNFEKVYTQLVRIGHWEGKTHITNKKGELTHVEASIVPSRNKEGFVTGYVIINKTVLTSNSINVLLREQVRSKPFINALAEGLVVRNAAGKILLCNKAAEVITGVSKKQMDDLEYLKATWNCIYEDGTPFPWEHFPTFLALTEGKPQKDVIIGLHKKNDGKLVWLNVNAHPVLQDTTKKIIGTVTSFTDITQIRAAQEELKMSEAKWRSVLNNNKNGIFLIDKDYRILLANNDAKERQRVMANVPEIKEGMSFFDTIPEARWPIVKDAFDRVLRGEWVEYQVVYTKANNDDLWLLVNYAPVRSAGGDISAICMTVNDITLLKKQEEALLKSEQRWKFALDGAGDGVWEYNFQTGESYYSPRYKAMLGFAEDELGSAVKWRCRVHPEDMDRLAAIQKAYESGQIETHSIEYRIQNKSGEYIWVLDRGMMLEKKDDGSPLKLIGTHKDISEQKYREENLIKSRQQFSSFMANTPTMNWIIDEFAIFRYLNHSYMKAFNLTEADIGKSIYEIFPKHICDGFIENNWKVWNTGQAHQLFEEGIGPDGVSQIYQIFKFPLEAENGVRLLGGVALDITQKSLLEQKLIEEQEKKKREIIRAIMSAQENERKELAYELHDNVNQILTSSRLMLEVAVEKPELSKDFVGRSLSYLQKAITELRKISHSLIPGTLRDISLQAAIEEVLQNINATEKLKITYHKQIDIGSNQIEPEIQLAILRITQEQFNNILKHAYASEARLSLAVKGDKISLIIQDNGCGFDPSTTKRGLGLNNIFNRVEYYHGNVEIKSATGQGCTLSVEIPVSIYSKEEDTSSSGIL